MNNVNCTSCHKSGAMRSAYCTLRLPPEVMVGTVLVPPPVRRGEEARSGAPSGMMAQTQPAQGCAVCGGPSDLAPDPRETAQRSDWRGKRPLVTLGLSKVTRPSPKGGRNPVEASGLASCTAKPCRIPPQKLQSGRLRLTANRPYDGTASPHQDPSPALPFAGEGAKASAPARSAAEHRPTVMTGGYQSKGGLAAPIGPKTPPSP